MKPATGRRRSPRRPVYDMVVVSNRLPVDYVGGPDGATRAGRARPAASSRRSNPSCAPPTAPGSAGPASPTASSTRSSTTASRSCPCRSRPTSSRSTTRGFSNDTLWPLYHDVIAPPSFHREWWDAYVRSTGGSRRRPPRPPRARWSGCRTTSCSSCRGCCASARPDLVIGFFNHIPFPAYGIYSQLPWRRQVIDGLLGADVIGFQRAADAGNFSRAVRRLFGLPTRGTVIEVPGGDGDDDRHVVRALPDLDRRGRLRGLAAPPRRPGARPRDPRGASATPSRSCSASTASTTPRASGTASRRSASSCATAGLGRGRHARAGREPSPRARRHVPAAARRDRAHGGPPERRLLHARPPADRATCTTATRARRWWRSTSPPTSCSSPRCATA